MVGFMRLAAFLLALAMLGQAGAQERLPDPTRPSIAEKISGDATAKGEAEQLRLESVLLGKQRQQAIISGEIYQIGQMVGNAKLVKIYPQEVHLLQNGKIQKLALFPGLEKKLTTSLKPPKR